MLRLRKQHQTPQLVVDSRQTALVLVLGHEKRLARNARQNRHGAVRRERAQRHVLAQKRAWAILRQAGAAARHELNVFQQGILADLLQILGLVRTQQPVPHAGIDGQQKEKQHNAVLVRNALGPHELLGAIEHRRDLGKARIRLAHVGHGLEHEHADKVRVPGKHDVEENVIHLEQAEAWCRILCSVEAGRGPGWHVCSVFGLNTCMKFVAMTPVFCVCRVCLFFGLHAQGL